MSPSTSDRICTILGRGGSKGLPSKNTRPFLGEPLIAHSIRQAKASGLFAMIAVSSDSEEIIAAGREAGADFFVRRPAEMANDEASKLPAIRHCVESAEKERGAAFGIIVDLGITSPLRSSEDIVASVRMLEEKKVSNVITAAPSKCPPYFSLVELDTRGVARLSKTLDKPLVRRQDAPACFDMNGSVYVWRRDALFSARPTVFFDDTALYVMPPERSIDIDTELEFEIAEFIAKKAGGAHGR